MPIFNLSVLTDEISQDFGRACEVASREFGMGHAWEELCALFKECVEPIAAEQQAVVGVYIKNDHVRHDVRVHTKRA